MHIFRSKVTTYACFVRQEMCSRSLSQAIIVIMQLLLVSPSHKVGYTMQCISTSRSRAEMLFTLS